MESRLKLSAATIAITDIKLYLPVVILSSLDNTKLLQHLKPGFKLKLNWNKCQSKKSPQAQNQYLDFFIDPSFQEVNKLFALSFQN